MMKELEIFLYDSFTHDLFGGNVAGVVLDARGLQTDSMQRIAAELAAPTTGFVIGDSNATFNVRFFTPTQEIDMCGHVTIAVFTALAVAGRLKFDASGVSRGVQRTAAGDLPIQVCRENDNVTVIMSQNRPTFWSPSLDHSETARLLGVSRSDIPMNLPFACASTALRHLFVPLRGLPVLRQMRPDFVSLANLSRTLGIDTIGVYCMDVERVGSTVHLRDLCPGIGNPEESASGTTNGALASLLIRHGLVIAENNVAEVVAEQGFEMGRPSIIRTWIRVENTEIVEVRVGGTAVRSLRGSVSVPV